MENERRGGNDFGPPYYWPQGTEQTEDGTRLNDSVMMQEGLLRVRRLNRRLDLPFHYSDPMFKLAMYYGGENTRAIANVLVDIFSAIPVLMPAEWQKVIELFRLCTDGWDKAGIGPIRSLYYLDILAGLPDDGACTFRFEDQPFFDRRGTAKSAMHWLAMDSYLGYALWSVGLSWRKVEKAVYDEFRGALPPAFDAVTNALPDPLVLIWWAQHVQNWLWFHANRELVAKRTHELGFRLKALPDDADYRLAIKSLLMEARALTWQADQPNLNLTDYNSQRRSPIINPLLEVLRDSIWQAMDNLRMTDAERVSLRPYFMERIQFAHMNESEIRRNYPDELWRVVADILDHLSVVKGLPQRTDMIGKKPLDEWIGWDAIRQRVGTPG